MVEIELAVLRNRYSWLPIICSVTWLITLLVMIFTWLGQGRPFYVESQNGDFPFISDIGADILKPWFVIGCIITSATFFATLFYERWLRHSGRLQPNTRKSQKVLAITAIVWGGLGSVSLIGLSAFDTKGYKRVHQSFLGLFILGVAMSAIFTCLEFMMLSRRVDTWTPAKISYVLKAGVVLPLVLAAIGMAACLSNHQPTVGAILEWVITFGFTLYPATFWIDLQESAPRGSNLSSPSSVQDVEAANTHPEPKSEPEAVEKQ